MKLNTFDRIALLGILPRQGDVTTLRIVRDLERELSFTEAEHATLELRRDGDRVVWNPAKDRVKDVPVGEIARRLIYDALEEMNRQKALDMTMLDLYERFVGVEAAEQPESPAPAAG